MQTVHIMGSDLPLKGLIHADILPWAETAVKACQRWAEPSCIPESQVGQAYCCQRSRGSGAVQRNESWMVVVTAHGNSRSE